MARSRRAERRPLARDEGGPAVSRADSPSWLDAERTGRAGEALAADCLRSLGFEVLQTLGNEPGYDLLAFARIEVKTDRRAAQTGNVAVEFKHNGRPSGLSATSALWWVVVAGGLVLFVPVRVLRDLLDAGDYRRVRAGDGSKAECVLLPLATLRTAPGVRVLREGIE